MTYEETFALTKDEAFRGRVNVSCVKFATFIVDEPPTTPAHSTRYRWAQNTMTSPEAAMQRVMPTLVWDPAVQADGAAITDPELQSSVEASVNKML